MAAHVLLVCLAMGHQEEAVPPRVETFSVALPLIKHGLNGGSTWRALEPGA